MFIAHPCVAVARDGVVSTQALEFIQCAVRRPPGPDAARINRVCAKPGRIENIFGAGPDDPLD